MLVTRSILGDVEMPPITVNDIFGLYWLPTKSPSNDAECIWISLHHILTTDTVTPKKTKKTLQNESTITIQKSLKTTKAKIQQASALERLVEMRMYENSSPNYNNTFIIKEHKSLYYLYVINKSGSGYVY